MAFQEKKSNGSSSSGEGDLVGVDARGMVGRMPIEKATVSLHTTVNDADVTLPEKAKASFDKAKASTRSVFASHDKQKEAKRRDRMEIYRRQRKTWLVKKRRSSGESRKRPQAGAPPAAPQPTTTAAAAPAKDKSDDAQDDAESLVSSSSSLGSERSVRRRSRVYRVGEGVSGIYLTPVLGPEDERPHRSGDPFTATLTASASTPPPRQSVCPQSSFYKK